MNENYVKVWMEELGGVASTAEVSQLTGLEERQLRDLAGAYRVRMIGPSFAWTADDVVNVLDHLELLEEPDDEEDSTEEEDPDEGDESDSSDQEEDCDEEETDDDDGSWGYDA